MELNKKELKSPLVIHSSDKLTGVESEIRIEEDSTQPSKRANMRMKAIVFINLSTLLATMYQVIYKQINLNGVGFLEFIVLKNCVQFVCNNFMLIIEKRNPISTAETKGKYFWLFMRAFFGQLNLAANVGGISLLPLSIFMVLWQTSGGSARLLLFSRVFSGFSSVRNAFMLLSG